MKILSERFVEQTKISQLCAETAKLPALRCSNIHQFRNVLRSLLGTTALVAIVAVAAPEAQAQQYWDGTSTTVDADGGSGNWEDTTTNWDSAETGGTDQAWADGAAVFGGAAGTVTVVGTQNNAGMTFDTAGYTVTGGTITLATSSTIDGGAGATTIASTLTGATVSKVGTGILTISGTSALTGTFTVAEGGVILGTGALGGTLSNLDVQDNVGLPSEQGSEVTLDLGGNTVNTGNFIVNGLGNTELSNGTLSFTGTGQLGVGTISAKLTGTGNLLKTGSGTGYLSGAHDYSGTTTVRKNTLHLLAGSSITSTTVTVGDTSTNATPTLIAEAGTLATGTNLEVKSNVHTDNSDPANPVDTTYYGQFQNNGSNTIATLKTVVGSTVTLDGGALTVTGGGTVSGSVTGSAGLTNNGGILSLSNAGNTATGLLTNTSGTVNLTDWSGSISNSATLNLTAGMTLGGTVTNNTGASLNNTSGAPIVVGGVTTFTSAATVAGAAGMTINATNVTYQDGHSETGTVAINVAAGGLLSEERTGDQLFNGTVDYNVQTGGAANFTTSTGFLTTGTLTHGSSGTFTVADNQTVSAATINLNSGTASIGTNATLAGTGNTMNIGVATVVGAGGTLTDANDINIQAAGSVTFAGNGTLSANTDDAGAEGITIEGELEVQNGGTVNASVGGSGAIVLQGVGLIDISDGGSHLNAAGVDIVNNSFATVGIEVDANTQLTAASIINGNNARLTNSGTINADVSNTTANNILTTTGTINGDVTNTLGTVNAAGTIAGTVTQNSGTFTMTGILAADALAGGGDIDNGGFLLTLDGDADATAESSNFGGAISGAGGLTVNIGEDTQVLSGANTYAGLTTITSGTLELSGGSAITDTGEISNAGTLVVSTAETIGALNGAGNVTLNTTLTTGDGGDDTISGIISGAGGLTKAGAGILTLSGANTYAGLTTISGGTLELSGGSAIADTSEISNAGTLLVSAAETIGALNGAGAVTLNASLTTGDAGDDTISGVITGSGGLTKAGTGTLILSGANTYTGDTTVGAGTLQISASERIADTSNLVMSGGTFDLNNNTETVANLSGTGSIDTGGTSGQLVVNQSVAGTYSGGFSGATGFGVNYLTKSGSETLTLSGTNTTTGDGFVEITDGTLQVQNGNAIGDNQIVTSTAAGAEFELLSDETIGILASSVGSSTTLNGNTLTMNGDLSGGVIASVRGDISGNGAAALVLNLDNDTLVLSGTNTFTGTTTINSGTLELNSGTAIVDTAEIITTGGILRVQVAETIGSMSGSGTIALNTNLTTGDAGDDTFSGNIFGIGGLTKTGSGTLTLTGANTFSGGITLAAGTLSLGSDAAAGTGTITTTGSVIDYANGVAIANLIDLNSDTTQLQTLAGVTATQSGSISETGGARPLEKIGAGTLTLSGVNTYTGATTISAGTLALSGGSAILDTGEVINAGTLQVDTTETIGSLSGAGAVVLNAGLTTGDSGNDTISGVISGAGAMTKTGSGMLTLTGANTFSGGITLAAGTLSLGSDTAAGTGTITTTGSVIDYANGVAIANLIDLNSDTTQLQTLAGVTATQSGSISETGGARPLEKIGAGTLTLSGVNTYTGTTTISAGTLALSGGSAILDTGEVINAGTLQVDTAETIGSLSGAGAVVLNAGLTTGDSGNDTISGVISGAGAMTKTGSGVLTLAGVNDYTGDTTVSFGRLQIDQRIAGNVVVDAGAFLTNNGTISGDVFNGGTIASASAAFGGLTNISSFTASGASILNGSFSNSGTASMANGATGDTLAVNGNMSGDGQLNLDTNYTTNTADTVLVDGSISNTTIVSLNSLTADDPAIGSELTLVTVSGSTNADDFVLAGGPIVVGSYDFDLALTGGEWALSGEVNPTGQAYEGAPVALSLLLNLPTLEQRRGQAGNLAASAEEQSLVGGSWARVFAKNFDLEPDGSTSGTGIDGNIGGMQVGYDHVFPEVSNGDWVIGLSGQFGSISSGNSNYSNKANALALGATATWFGNQGWYSDGQVQVSFLNSNLSAGSTDLIQNEKGYGAGFSAEFGKRLALSTTSAIVPQAQISWTHLNGGSFSDTYGNSVSVNNIRSTVGRLGLAYEYFDARQNSKFYATGSVLHDFSNDNTVIVDNVPLEVGEFGTWADIGVGLSKHWEQDSKFYAEMSSRQSLQGGGGRGFSITAGFEFKM